MKKVIPVAQMGQGSVPPCVCAPCQARISPEPAPGEDRRAAEASELAPPSPPPERSEGPSLLLQNRPLPALQPSAEFAIEPMSSRTLEEGILRSLSRRAMRAVRPLIQGSPQQELWVAGFDGCCRVVALRRLLPGPQGQLDVTIPLVMGWAEATGARAIVLVQNQLGSRRLATSIDLTFTLTLAAAAALSPIIFVDHVIIHGAGSSTHLRQRGLLPEVQVHAALLQQSIGALSSAHTDFGLQPPTHLKAKLP